MQTADFVAHFRAAFPDFVGSRVLVALSGGRDSVALLHLLSARGLSLELAAAHVHHGLRGTEADADAEFCRALCAGLGLPFALLALPDDGGRPSTGEAAWRRRRYRALLDHAAALGIPTVATAHHRDDVAEGVLVQMLRGAGPRAMAGITAETGDGVIRPLLPWSRDELGEWLERHRIPWREDSSNLDRGRLRNRVRHELLPQLEGAAPRLREHLVSLAGALAEAEAHMATEVERQAAFADPWHPDGGVPLSTLRRLPRALRTRWLHGQMHRLGVSSTTRRQLELFHLLLDAGSPRSVTMGDRWRLRAAGGRLWAEPPVSPTGIPATLLRDRSVGLGMPGWSARVGVADDAHPRAVWRWRPRSENTSITVRSAVGGEPLVVAPGSTRNARALVAERLPRHLRDAWPVFCEDGMIRWIPGVWQHPDPGDPSNRVVEVIRQ